jgi:histidinol phosphatase-like PHP family hydrolase
LIPRALRTRGMTFEYFRVFDSEFEKKLGYESGIHMGSIHEINKRLKISCYCPFKSSWSIPENRQAKTNPRMGELYYTGSFERFQNVVFTCKKILRRVEKAVQGGSVVITN